MRRAFAVVLVIAAVCGAAWLLWPKEPDDDRALIRKAIDAMALAAEKKDIGGLLEPISPRYQGEGGGKQELKSYLLGYILRADWVSVVPSNVEVTLEGNSRAKVSLVVLLARTARDESGQVSPEGVAGSHKIDAVFEREDEGWKVVSATRQDASLGDWMR